MADIFISYSSEDKSTVQEIASLLEAKGWSVWWDREIPIGQKFDEVIERELQNARCVVVIWTQRSVNSQWVKNEALEAAQKNKLVPLMLEEVTLPLAFKRIEAAMLIGWKGEESNPELQHFYASVNAVLNPSAADSFTNAIKPTGGNGTDTHGIHDTRRFFKSPVVLLVLGILLLLVTVFILWKINHQTGISEKTVTIRLFDWKKNPITAGNVKIYLNEYIRSQSVDNVGQALFTGIPGTAAQSKMKIEVSSPGFATKTFDTLVVNDQPLELVLPLTTVVNISGRVKTAAELPIKGVEISVDGTRYYAVSITDGTYNLRLEEYTLGDEISLTTSHPNYEDKTVSLRITSPDIKGEDIFLNPVQKNH